MAPLPSTRINELYKSDQYANVREQSLLVWLNNKMEVGQSNLVKYCVTYFGDFHPIHVARAQKYSYLNEVLDRKGGCVHQRYHHHGIISSRICCRITSDANIAGDPEKNNIPFLLD